MSRRPIWIARAAWLAYAGVATVAYVFPIVHGWNDLQKTCFVSERCNGFQIDRAAAITLSRHGISLDQYAVFVVALLALLWLATFGLAAVIVWRKPGDRGALVTAFFLVTYPMAVTVWWGYYPSSSGHFPSSLSTATWLVLQIAPFLSLTFFLMLFPDGRFVPGWTRWLALGSVALIAASVTVLTNWLWLFPYLVLPFILVGVQVYRYRSTSSGTQRQQTKWAFYGFVVTVLGIVALALVETFTPGQYAGSLNKEGMNLLTVADLLIVPMCISVAVLHSHLWDIDRIINQTLVYVALTVTLGAIYVGLVLSIENVSHLLIGGGSGLAVALSTLATAALFRPFRGSIQTAIDRRFYRGRYDAQRTLASFSQRVRDQVDLAELAEDLEGVVMRALHPQCVGWWLNEAASTTRHPRPIEDGESIRMQQKAPDTVHLEQTPQSTPLSVDEPLTHAAR